MDFVTGFIMVTIGIRQEGMLLLAIYLLGVATPLILLRLITKDHEDTCLLNLVIAAIITLLIVLIAMLAGSFR